MGKFCFECGKDVTSPYLDISLALKVNDKIAYTNQSLAFCMGDYHFHEKTIKENLEDELYIAIDKCFGSTLGGIVQASGAHHNENNYDYLKVKDALNYVPKTIEVLLSNANLCGWAEMVNGSYVLAKWVEKEFENYIKKHMIIQKLIE
jgi:hypothetical protein